MDARPPQSAKLQVVDGRTRSGSVLPVEPEAAHYSDHFHARVVTYFAGCKSMRRTAKSFDLSVRVVNEILHLAALRCGPVREASVILFGRRAA